MVQWIYMPEGESVIPDDLLDEDDEPEKTLTPRPRESAEDLSWRPKDDISFREREAQQIEESRRWLEKQQMIRREVAKPEPPRAEVEVGRGVSEDGFEDMDASGAPVRKEPAASSGPSFLSRVGGGFKKFGSGAGGILKWFVVVITAAVIGAKEGAKWLWGKLTGRETKDKEGRK